MSGRDSAAVGRFSCYTIRVSRPPDRPPWPPLVDPYLQPHVQPNAAARARRRQRRNTIGCLLGGVALTLVVLLGAGAYLAVDRGALSEWTTPDDDDDASRRPKTPTADDDGDKENEDEDDGGAVAQDDPPDTSPGTTSPGATESRRVGDITVVDVGRATPVLRRALRAQQRAARENDQQLLLMVTGFPCEPCRGVDAALVDKRLQRALSGVRLVRVDYKTFLPELLQLEIPLAGIPAFFLLDEESRPVDGIDGGEWDADIPANIAPVLGPFLRGSYHQRRRPWAPSSGSVRL